MRIAYLKIRNLDSHERKALSYWIGGSVSYFNGIIKDLITKSNENLLLKDKKSRLSLERSSFLLDGRRCISLLLSLSLLVHF